MIQGLIFDKDGTLFDFRRSWARWVHHLLDELASNEAHRRTLAEAIHFDLDRDDFGAESPVIGCTAPEIADDLLPLLPGMAKEPLVARMNALAVGAAMAEAVPLLPLLPLFQRLQARGLKIGLATNDTEAPARAHLRNHGVLELFNFVAGYDSGFGGKPAPGQLAAFARLTGLMPGRVAMIGDSRHDMEAGRAAGMICIAVLTGIATRDELAPHADVVLPDIGALPDWLDAFVPA